LCWPALAGHSGDCKFNVTSAEGTHVMSTASWHSERIEALGAAMAEAARRLAVGDAPAAFASLERAHVLGQRDFLPHLRVHLRMLRVAVALRDGREVFGQLLRLLLVPIGHLARRLPLGNTGGSNVSAFQPMPVSPELKRLLDDKSE
jgi:hypothetical protein